MDRSVNESIVFLTLFDIVASTATGIAAPVIGADDIVDGTAPIDDNDPALNPSDDDQPDFSAAA
jgi:hypothetical protein